LPGSMASGIIVLSARDPSGLISLYSLPGSMAFGIIVLSALRFIRSYLDFCLVR